MATIRRRVELLEGRRPRAGAKRSRALVIHAVVLTPDEKQALLSQLRLELAEGAKALCLPDNGRDGYLPDGKRWVIL